MVVYYAPRSKSQAALLALVLLMVLQGDVRSQVMMSWSQVGSPGNPAGMYGRRRAVQLPDWYVRCHG